MGCTSPPELDASIVRMYLSCLVDLYSDFYCLCGLIHGLDTFGASIVRMYLSCLVDLYSDFYCLCGLIHGLNTFWAWGSG